MRVTTVSTDVTGDVVTNTEYDLGLAGVDAAATPSASLTGAGLGLVLPEGISGLAGTGGLTAGNFPSTYAPPSTPAKSVPAPRLVLTAASRKPLAMGFLGWEALVMCGVAAWVWARKTVTG